MEQAYVLTIQPSGVETIVRVSLCRSDDVARYQLTGVYLDFARKRAVATDGKMLAIGNLANAVDPDEKGEWGEEPMILSAECCAALRKLYSWRKDKDGKPQFGLKRGAQVVPKLRILRDSKGNRFVTFPTGDNGDIRTFCELDGRFPDYAAILPKDIQAMSVQNQKLDPEYLMTAQKVLVLEYPPDSRQFIALDESHPGWLANGTVTMAIMPLVCADDEARSRHEENQRTKIAAILKV
jgi:hypothetical protein